MDAGQDLDHCGLASAVLAEHDNDFGGIEFALRDVDLEVSESLNHVRIVVVSVLKSLFLLDLLLGELTLIFLHVILGRDSEGQFIITEAHLFCWNVASQEYVDTLTYGEGHSDHSVGTGSAVKTTNEVR